MKKNVTLLVKKKDMIIVGLSVAELQIQNGHAPIFKILFCTYKNPPL